MSMSSLRMLSFWHRLWIISLLSFSRGCPVNDSDFTYPEFYLIKQADYTVYLNQPLNVSCEVNCTINLSGCYLMSDWFVRVNTDNYERHSLITDRHSEEGVVSELVDHYDFSGSSRPLCEGDRDHDSFNIVFTSTANYDEILLTCGLRRRGFPTVEGAISIAPVRRYVPNFKIFSQQIEDSPSMVINEGDNATITCEKPVSDANLTRMYWTLTAGSDLLPNDTSTLLMFNDSESDSLELNNGHTLSIDINSSIESDLQAFSITISNLTLCLSGLTIHCGVWWVEGNFYQLYGQAAVITVLPTEKLRVFSDQAKSISTVEGDNVTLICKRSAGSIAEWLFLFPDGIKLYYTKNESTLREMGLYFHNSTAIAGNLEMFSVTLMNINGTFNNSRIRCAAKKTVMSNIVVNSFEDVILVEKEFNIVYSNDTDRLRLLTLQTGHDERRITCTKRKGYLSDVRVLLLNDNGTISDSQELKFSTDKDMLNNLGVTLSESVHHLNVGISWQSFDILLRNLTSSMTVACGARNTDNGHLAFYNYIVVTVSKPKLYPDPPPTSCFGDPRIVSSISSLIIVVVIAIATAIVAIVFAINLYLRIRLLHNRDTNGQPDEIQFNPAALNHDRMNNIQVRLGEAMVGQNDIPDDLELRLQNINNFIVPHYDQGARQEVELNVLREQMPGQEVELNVLREQMPGQEVELNVLQEQMPGQEVELNVLQEQMPGQNLHMHALYNLNEQQQHEAQSVAQGIQQDQMFGQNDSAIPNQQEAAVLRNRLPVHVHPVRANSSPWP